MEKKANKQNDRQPFDYFKDTAVYTQGSNTEDHSINKLRSEILTNSQLLPAEVSIIHRINYKLLAGVIIAVIILSLILYSVVGAGRVKLENSLIGLANVKSSMTPETLQSPTPMLFQNTTTKNSVNPSPSFRITTPPTITKTALPTLTPLSFPSISPTFTHIPALTSTPTCRNAKSITLDDVGKTLCVQGIIIETVEKPTNFMVVFSTEMGAFYWVSYDMVWTKGEVDKCYQLTGKIDQIGISPMLIFDYSNIPQECQK